MDTKTGKPLPLQMLRMFLKRAVEVSLESNDPTKARALATTLEKHVIQLRWKHGGESLISTNQPKQVKPVLYRTICCGHSYESKIKGRLEKYNCQVCGNLLKEV